ncbi:MAG: hypothetical protein KDA89_24000, partial [Planctomycetaceae bacterium]|nr:hypothetical protein [Planctomycetaceae bacterium]
MIKWVHLFNGADLCWCMVCSAAPLLFVIPAVRRLLIAERAESAAFTAVLPLFVGVHALAWACWGYTLSFGPSLGTEADIDQSPRPMISLQEMAEIGETEQDETHLYGRGGVVGNFRYLFLNDVCPVPATGGLVFPVRRPNYTVPHTLEFLLRCSNYLIAMSILSVVWWGWIPQARLVPATLIWSALTYSPAAHAVIGDGWMDALNVLDHGMGVVLLSVSFSGLFGFRHSDGILPHEPSSTGNAGDQSLLLWLGLSVLIGGQTFQADGRAVISL